MAALVLVGSAEFDAAAFAAWIDAQSDLGPKWRPRYVRVATELPRTPTHKVLHRQLQHEKFRLDRVGADAVFVRGRGASAYEKLDDDSVIAAEFAKHGRERFWDL